MVKRLQGIKPLFIVSFALAGLLVAGILLPAASANPLIAQASSYSTYFGGTDGEDATKVAFDNEGNTILIGQTPSDDFPITTNALQDTYGGGDWDGFVAKFSSSGDLLYSSYLGGSGYEHVTSVNIDSGNNIVLTGTTGSSNFPTTLDALDSTFGGLTDGFLMKIAPNGTLLYSTFIGGAGNDWIYGIQFDANGNYMFSGWTDSTGLGTSGSLHQNPIGGTDGFIARVSSNGAALQMFSYLGGTGNDRIYVMDIDSEYNYVLAGITASSNYEVTGGAFQSISTASGDAVLTKINHDGNSLVYSTYLGGNDDDFGLGVAVDSADNMIISGYTESDDLAVLNAQQATFGGGIADIYVAKFNETGGLQFLTYLGGIATDYCWDIAVDPSDNIIIGGRTSSSNYPAHDGLNDTLAGSYDAVATKYAPDGQTIIASSFVGGSGSDIGEGIAVDGDGNVVLSGRTVSENFPVTAGAYQEEIGGSSDVFVCHIAFSGYVTTTTTTTNISTTITTDGTGLPIDTTTLLLIGAGGIAVVIILVIFLKKK
ncbi:hypothetical protein EU528_13285 [Candidatus Thorarchaeota archaeon]|nr:MAG: hypothetical protein EU528_13285 [Candidatus Thorarchaeota archaeon]